MRDQEETRRLFDRWAADYDHTVEEDGPLQGYRGSLERAAVLAAVTSGERVLDVGIGTGGLAVLLAAGGAEIRGVDQSPEMLDRCAAKQPGFRLHTGDFLHLPLPDRSFDVVVSSFALHHLAPEEYDAAFGEILRVLVPGGRFVIADIIFEDEAARETARRELGPLWDDDEVYPLVPDLVRAAHRAGAERVASHRLGGFHWAVTAGKPGDPRDGGG